jgi:Tfp pilus assembly protein PilX
MSMSTLRSRRAKLSHSEQGMVSIMVTLVLMIVLSLIVLGFAQISRRNQRETLDQQLSTAAFYAAESGVNDAAQLINNALSAGTTVYAKPTCAAPSTPAAAAFYANLPSSTINSANDVSYSCLTTNLNPNSLSYGDVSTTPVVFPLTTTTGLNFTSVTFTWNTKANTSTPTNGCPTSTTKAFPTSAAWSSSGCGYGVLRFDLVPTNSSSLTASSLASSAMTAFVVPLKSGGTSSVNFAAGSSNTTDVIGGNCNNSQCSLTVSFPTATSNEYYARVSSLYNDVTLNVTGSDSSSSQTDLSGAQVVIDATGKAQDVLRRIEVRASTTDSTTSTGTGQLPYYALGSGSSICKEFTTTGSASTSYFSNSAKPSDGSGNQLCQ